MEAFGVWKWDLRRAIEHNNFQHVKEIIETEISSYNNISDIQALQIAYGTKNMDMVKFFLEFTESNYLLDLAATHNDIETLNLISTYPNFDINMKCFGNPEYNALTYCCEQNRYEGAKWLIEHGININNNRSLALLIAIQKHKTKVPGTFLNTTKIIELLVESGIDVHGKWELPLILAIGKNDLHIVKLLVEHGADLHHKKTKVLEAACSDYVDIEILKYILDQGNFDNEDLQAVYDMKVYKQDKKDIVISYLKQTLKFEDIFNYTEEEINEWLLSTVPETDITETLKNKRYLVAYYLTEANLMDYTGFEKHTKDYILLNLSQSNSYQEFLRKLKK